MSGAVYRLNLRADRRFVPAETVAETRVMVRWTATGTAPARTTAQHVVFVIDRSEGAPEALAPTAVSGIARAAVALSPAARVGIVLVDRVAHVLAPLGPTNALAGRRANEQPSGACPLLAGWVLAAQLLAATERAAPIQRIVVVTSRSGYDLSPLQAAAGLLRKHGVSTTVVGVGAQVLLGPLLRVSHAGGGNGWFAPTMRELTTTIHDEVGSWNGLCSLWPVLTLSLPPGGRVLTPLAGAELGASRVLLPPLTLDVPQGVLLRLVVPPSVDGTEIAALHAVLTLPSLDGQTEQHVDRRLRLHAVAPSLAQDADPNGPVAVEIARAELFALLDPLGKSLQAGALDGAVREWRELGPLQALAEPACSHWELQALRELGQAIHAGEEALAQRTIEVLRQGAQAPPPVLRP